MFRARSDFPGNASREGSWHGAVYPSFTHPNPPSYDLRMDDLREREISGKTVKIDRTLCIGSGNCTNLAPEIFVIREDNIVDFQDDTPDIEEGRLEEAVAVCPVDALLLFDEDGEQIVP